MRGWDYMVFVPEICKAIATLNAVESFIGTASCESGYNDFGSVQMNYENGLRRTVAFGWMIGGKDNVVSGRFLEW